MQRSLLIAVTLLSTIALIFVPEASGRPQGGAGGGSGTGAAACSCPLGLAATPVVDPPPCALQMSMIWSYADPGWCDDGECGPEKPCVAIVQIKLLSTFLPGCSWVVLDPHGRTHTGTGNYTTPPVGIVLECGAFATFNVLANSFYMGALIVTCKVCQAATH